MRNLVRVEHLRLEIDLQMLVPNRSQITSSAWLLAAVGKAAKTELHY
jgi:hypothetical protein